MGDSFGFGKSGVFCCDIYQIGSFRWIFGECSGGYLESDIVSKLVGLDLCFLGDEDVLKANAGTLTNFEVLDFLQSRGAAKDSARIIVFDYLEQSAACNQTRERITEFVKKCKKYNLAKAEILNIINIRPSSVVEIDPIIEECESRLGDCVEELVELVAEVLPAPPTQTESDDAGFEDKQEIPDGATNGNQLTPYCSVELETCYKDLEGIR
ncbi:unnamed protein product [Camellia sinensis]